MRGLVFLVAFIASIPLIFVNPFNGVLVWYVFSLGNFHTVTWGVFGGLYYGYIIAIATCLSWMLSREKKSIPLTPLSVMTLLFMVWITMTTVAAASAAPDRVKLAGYDWEIWNQWKTVEKILFMCLVGYALTTTRERVDQLIWVVVLAIGAWGVKGGIWSILLGGTARIHGPDGTAIGDNNDFGLALILILPLMFYKWQYTENRHIRRGLIVMAILVTTADLFTYSRGALVGLCAMGAVTWLRSRAKLAIGVLIVTVGLAAYAFAPPQWFNRMQTIETYEQDSSAMSRIYMWNVVADDGESVSTRYTANDGRAGLAQRLLCSPLRAWLDRSRAVSSDRRLFVDKLLVVDQAIARPVGPSLGQPSRKNGSSHASRILGRRDLSLADLFGRILVRNFHI